MKSNKLSISSKALYYKINSLLNSKVRVEGHRFLRQGQLVPLKRGSKKTLREKILKEKIDIMVDKSQFLRNRVHQLEKLCNDHISNRDPRIKKFIQAPVCWAVHGSLISNLNEYDREIEALIETVSELGTISIFIEKVLSFDRNNEIELDKQTKIKKVRIEQKKKRAMLRRVLF